MFGVLPGDMVLCFAHPGFGLVAIFKSGQCWLSVAPLPVLGVCCPGGRLGMGGWVSGQRLPDVGLGEGSVDSPAQIKLHNGILKSV